MLCRFRFRFRFRFNKEKIKKKWHKTLNPKKLLKKAVGMRTLKYPKKSRRHPNP